MVRQIDPRSHRYMKAVASVMAPKSLLPVMKSGRVIPFRFIGYPVFGPQAATATVQIPNENDLAYVASRKMEEKMAMKAGAEFVRIYRDRGVVRIEFTLPDSEWRVVKFSELQHHKNWLTFGELALGGYARLDLSVPHKLIFGATRSGKTICLMDIIISLVRMYTPNECKILIANPKNDENFKPFERLRHLERRIANGYEASLELMRYALAEMEQRIGDPERIKVKMVVALDELAEMARIFPEEIGHIVSRMSQVSGGLNMHVIGLSQAANPSVFGKNGSLARANFPSRLIFHLEQPQAYMATGMQGRQPEVERLGITDQTKGDGLAVLHGQVSRFRAALPSEVDFDSLPRYEIEPAAPAAEELAGDRAIEQPAKQPEPVTTDLKGVMDRVAYAVVFTNGKTGTPPASATMIRQQFGGATAQASLIRDLTNHFMRRVRYWRQIRKNELLEAGA